jgi:hypothetical protein
MLTGRRVKVAGPATGRREGEREKGGNPGHGFIRLITLNQHNYKYHYNL